MRMREKKIQHKIQMHKLNHVSKESCKIKVYEFSSVHYEFIQSFSMNVECVDFFLFAQKILFDFLKLKFNE